MRFGLRIVAALLPCSASWNVGPGGEAAVYADDHVEAGTSKLYDWTRCLPTARRSSPGRQPPRGRRRASRSSSPARGAARRGLPGLLFAFALWPVVGEAAPPPAPDGKEWVLVWSDEFDGTALDPTKWGLRGEAFRQDRYQNRHRVQWRYEDDNVEVRDGKLVLRNTRESVSDGDDSWSLLKAAAVSSKGKFEQTYGYFEASVRIAPTFDGVHTAFWLQNDARNGTSSNGGVDGASDGAEIDILESVYVTPHYHMAVHWDGGRSEARATAFGPVQDGRFHVYAVAWTPAGYVFHADGQDRWSTSRGVSDSDGYVILSTGASWLDGNVRTGTFPNEAQVDWVRVYALADVRRVNATPSGLPTVSGSPLVGAVLAASAAEIEDADGLTEPGFAWQWIANDGTRDADIGNATGERHTLTAAEAGKTIKVRVTFTDDGGSEETLVSAATDAVAWLPLAASFADVPAGHDGTPFAAGLEFAEEADGISDAWVRETLAAAAQGTVLKAERATTSPPLNRSWTLTVDPASAGADVVLSLASGAALPNGRAVAPGGPATVRGQSLSVADATGREGGAASFAVTLDRGATGTVTVDYATSDGTATAGADYAAASGSLAFAPGERAKAVAVALLADEAEEDDETFSLTLSNASGAALADGTAAATVRDAPAAPRQATLSALSVTQAQIAFDQETTAYAVAVPYGVARVTVAATPADAAASTAIEPPDADAEAPGHQVSLAAGGDTEIVVTVTARDGVEGTYTVTVTRPRQSAFFGDLHIHTMYSYDAFRLNSERNTPDDAYRYAKGEALDHPAGGAVQLSGPPLDFLAVTDHAEWLGTDAAEANEHCESDKMGEPCQVVIRSTWRRVVEAAERHNAPGTFTTLVGYEYGASQIGPLHRNVLFRSASVPPTPFSAWHSHWNPQLLWNWLDRQRAAGIDALAIAHTSNASRGIEFRARTWAGAGMTRDFAEQRMRNEPSVEVYQNKGASEVYPGASPNDEWADFQLKWNRVALEMAKGSFWRSGLNTGLTVEAELGANPFQLGVVGGSDTHVTAGSYDEDAYFTNRSTTPEERLGVYRKDGEDWVSEPIESGAKARNGTGGLTGIWASGNTRAALFDAIRRRETFATSGPRMQVRFFGGFGLAEGVAAADDAIAAGYEHGVPMGGVLGAASGAPSFLVWAMRDPGGGRLQRLQVVKGWLEDGAAHERVVDVACSDDLVPDAGRCPDNGAAVDLDDCSVGAGKGAAEIRTVWTDPDFDATQRSYYYVRVLENPSCRWSTWDAVRLGAAPNPGLPATHQERAWTSPIWFDQPVPPASDDATLDRLGLEAVQFGPFQAGTTAYTAAVPHGVSATTVTAVASDERASVAILPPDADVQTAGHQVALAVGENPVTATVTAEDGESTRTYTVVVTRAAAPTATLSAVAAAVEEGAAATFEVTLSAAQPVAVTIPATVTAVGVVPAGPVPASATVAAGDTAARLSVATADDSVVSGGGTVTAALLAGNGYALGETTSATVAVAEDDAAEFAVAAVPAALVEGGEATLTVSIANGTTFAAPQPIALAATGVSASDYTLTPATLTLAAGASSASATFAALDDGVAEAPETATVAALLEGTEIGRATVTVSDPPPPPQVRVEGVPQVGATLTAVLPGRDSGSSAVGASAGDDADVALQWLRDGTEVAGATGRAHVLSAADAGAAVSVRAARGGRSTASAATIPVWSPPSSPPAEANEEALYATTMTLGSTDEFPVRIAGFMDLPSGTLGDLDAASFDIGGTQRAVRLFVVRGDGHFGLATDPSFASPDALRVYWDGHRIAGFDRAVLDGLTVWTAPTPQPSREYRHYFGGASDGVRVAVAVRRALPPPKATLAAAVDAVAEGEAAVFRAELSRAPNASLAVAVSVSAEGAELSGSAPESAEFAAGETTATLSLPTADDAVVSDDGTVTARLLAGDGYALGDPAEATVAVTEDDTAEFAVTASPAELVEGGAGTVMVSIANGATYAEARDIALSVTGDVAASDYALSTDTELPAGSSSAEATFTAVEDETQENPETATVTATVDGAAVGAATLSIRDASADATLANLTLTDVDVGAFDPETTAYAGTAAGVESTTVAATPADANAAVEIADAAGSTLGTERTSALSTGTNEIATTVTAEDGRTTRTYAVTVTRPPSWGARLPDRDIDVGGSGTATGVWSDSTTLWVVPSWYADSLWAFDLATGARLEERDIALPEERTYTALTGYGATLWAAVYGEARVEAYRLPGGTRLADGDLAEPLSSAGNDSPTGLWADASALRVADMTDKRIYAYALPDGRRSATSEFDLDAPDTQTIFPWGLWSDGATALVSWWGRGTVRAFRLSDGARQPQFDIDTGASGNADPQGLWSNGETLWVLDGTDRKLYAYAATGLQTSGGSAGGMSSRALPVPSSAPGPAVSIPDPALRGRIAAALGKPADAGIGANELLALQALDLRGAGVADLTGLERATNLAELDLAGNRLTEATTLSLLPRLRTLNVDGTGVDPWTLAGLAALRILSLRDNGLEDLRGLSGLSGLEILDIGGNRVADLAPLATLRSLRVLRADGNAIRTVEPLAGLEALETLDLRGNPAAVTPADP